MHSKWCVYEYETTAMFLYWYSCAFFLVVMFSIFCVIKNLDFWIKIAETTFSDRNIIKSGWDEIEGNKITELKLQFRYKF